MAVGRPYPSRDELLRFADLKFRSLTKTEWMEAFAHFVPLATTLADDDRFSEEEHAELSALCQQYYRRFGHVYICNTSGLEPREITAQLRRRLRYDPYDEFVAAGENLRMITRGKLDVLVDGLARDVDPAELQEWVEQHRVAKPPRRVQVSPIAPTHDPQVAAARERAIEQPEEPAKKSA